MTTKTSSAHPNRCDFTKQEWYPKLSPENRAFLDSIPEEITIGEDENEAVAILGHQPPKSQKRERYEVKKPQEIHVVKPTDKIALRKVAEEFVRRERERQLRIAADTSKNNNRSGK